MFTNYNIPFGKPIPYQNTHAASVSFPKFSDIVAAKENIDNASEKIESGYPRFFEGKNQKIVKEFFKKKLGISENQEIFLLPSAKALNYVKTKFQNYSQIIEYENIFAIIYDKNQIQTVQINDLIRHTGLRVFSRQLEDFLFNKKIIEKKQPELRTTENSEEIIKNILLEAYKAAKQENIILTSCGMSAVNAVFEAIKKKKSDNNKTTFVQFGWLYLDTIEILKKYSEKYIEIVSVFDIQKLENVLNDSNRKIAAVFTELPTNPYLNTCDLPSVSQLCKTNEIPLVVDGTIASPFNVEILKYCDFAVESLSKFACGNADLLAGAIIINPESEFARSLRNEINDIKEDLYISEKQRLAYQIEDYKNLIVNIRPNVKKLAEFFEKSDKVKKVYWSHSQENEENYKKIEKSQKNYAPLISVEFKGNFAEIYDKLDFPKGPSLGTEFTLIMPYFYLANYDQIKTPEGRKEFTDKGINPDMIRISVGLEPIEELIKRFEYALS